MPHDTHCPSKYRIPLVPALKVLADRRRDAIIVTTMGPCREWPRICDHPLDLHYIPSAMGQAPSLALGLALALPHKQVIVLNGDGSLLMNLGSLVTLAASGVQNLTMVVFDNGVYEVTGAQRTAAVAAGVNYLNLARACGFKLVHGFDRLGDWQFYVEGLLPSPGLKFVSLQTEVVTEDFHVKIPGPIGPRLDRFRQALLG